MRLSSQRPILTLLPLVLLLAAGCFGTSPTQSTSSLKPRTSPRPGSHPPSAAIANTLRATSPRPFGSASPAPRASASGPAPTRTPTPSPQPSFPSVMAQPVAVNALGTTGASGATTNMVVVSGTNAKTENTFKLSVTDASSAFRTVASLPVAPRRTLSTSGDSHLAFQAWQARHVTPLLPTTPHYRVQATTALTVGAEVDFNVIVSFVETDYKDVKVTARVAEVAKHCYVMVDEAVDASASDKAAMNLKARHIGQVFDDQIYPTDTRLFGAEPNPGVDGDPRIFILLSPAVGNYGKDNTLGFFSQRDEYVPKPSLPALFQHSNAKDMIYVSSRIVLAGSEDDYLGTLAHEFQHMINFNQKVLVNQNNASEDLWIDEGMAMYAIEANGYGLKGGGQVLANHVKKFQSTPSSFSLTDWDDNPDESGYGPVYLFMVYLADRFGESLIHELVTSKAIGAANLNEVLQGHGTGFDRVFHDWAVANVLDALPQVTDPIYHYSTLKMAGTNGTTQLSGFALKTLGLPGSSVFEVRPYTTHYFKLPAGPLTPRFAVDAFGDAGVVPRLILP